MVNEPFDEKAVFNIVRDMAAHEERMSYLQKACAENPEALARILDLLRVYDRKESFLESPPINLGGTVAQPDTESAGAVIGPYKLIEQIGEGGMGAVWMAEQTEPVKRLVALKLIKAGMDSKQVIARFEAERQALALMDHPNIARVLDGGTTSAGRPYFVMDLVKGVPITKYCDGYRLTPRQRLELFLPVCQAIQHAHQKGIIHRDLKPSNVLVALYDGKPVPKVIDFGVAKAAGQSLTDKTLVTGFGNVVGTLEYMSPEQAEINQLDIDTRSDIYSLGVLLYELLTGSPPFTRKELEKAGMFEMLRMIREQEPSKPSTKLNSSEALATLSANRGTEPAKLTKLVRGELDWIVMKALEKDRNRRYETANGFAMDVQRYLADEPVQACPPSAWYQARKFAKRHRVGLALATSLTLAVLLAAGGVLWAEYRESLHAGEKATRAAQVKREVELAQQEAVRFRDLSREPRKDPIQVEAELTAALGAVRRAETLLASSNPGTELQEQVRALADELRVEDRDRRMVNRLEVIRMIEAEPNSNSAESSQAKASRLYGEAFRDYGIDVQSLDVGEAGRRIGQRAIHSQLVAILDNWAWITPDDALHRRLRQVADVADPGSDSFTYRIRRIVAGHRLQTRSKLGADGLEALRQLARNAPIDRLAPTTLADLGTLLFFNGAAADAVHLLRRGQLQYPDNFWVNRQLANALLSLGPSLQARMLPGNQGPELPYERSACEAEALAFLYASLSIRPRNARTWLDIGDRYASQNRPDQAITAYDQALRFQPEYVAAQSGRAAMHARLGKWEQAASEFAQMIERRPHDVLLWYFHAMALLGGDDLEGYRRACAGMQRQFRETKNPAIAARVVFTCVVAPEGVGDPADLLRLCRIAVGYPRARASAYHRNGQYEDAVRCYGDSSKQGPLRGVELLFLAMAQHGLDKTLEARATFARASEWFDEARPLGSTWTWCDQVEVRRLRGEAEKLLVIK